MREIKSNDACVKIRSHGKDGGVDGRVDGSSSGLEAWARVIRVLLYGAYIAYIKFPWVSK